MTPAERRDLEVWQLREQLREFEAAYRDDPHSAYVEWVDRTEDWDKTQVVTYPRIFTHGDTREKVIRDVDGILGERADELGETWNEFTRKVSEAWRRREELRRLKREVGTV